MSDTGIPWNEVNACVQITTKGKEHDQTPIKEERNFPILLPLKKKWAIPDNCKLIPILTRRKARGNTIEIDDKSKKQKQDLEGKIGLCLEESIEDIEIIIRQSHAKFKMCGIIVSKAPVKAIKIPVVVLDIYDIRSLAQVDVTVTVRIDENPLADTHYLQVDPSQKPFSLGHDPTVMSAFSEKSQNCDPLEISNPEKELSKSSNRSGAKLSNAVEDPEGIEIPPQGLDSSPQVDHAEIKSREEQSSAKIEEDREVISVKKGIKHHKKDQDPPSISSLTSKHTVIILKNESNESAGDGKSVDKSAKTSMEIYSTNILMENQASEKFHAREAKVDQVEPKMNFWEKGVHLLKEALGTTKSEVQKKMESLLEKSMLWSEEKDFSSFRSAMGLYAHTAKTQDWKKKTEDQKYLTESILQFMECQSFRVDPLFLVFAIFLYRRSGNDKLRPFISKCILNFVPQSLGPQLKFMQLGKFKPCCYLSSFIVDEMNKNESLLRITKNEMVISVLWALNYHCSEEHLTHFPRFSFAQGQDVGVFTESEKLLLGTFMDNINLASTVLAFQPSLERFCQVFFDFSNSKAGEKNDSTTEVVLAAHSFEHFAFLIEGHLKVRSNHFPCAIVTNLLGIMGCKSDGKGNAEKVIDAIISGLSFEKRGSFVLLNELYLSVYESHPHHYIFHGKLLKYLRWLLHSHNRYPYNSVTVKDVEGLFHLPLMNILLMQPTGRDAIASYTDAALSIGTFEETLEYLHKLFSVTDNDLALHSMYDESQMKDWINQVLKKLPVIDAFRKTFTLVKKNPSLFDLPCTDKTALNLLVSGVASIETAVQILGDPQAILSVFDIDVTNISQDSSLLLLIEGLKKSLIGACKNLQQASKLFACWCLNKAEILPHLCNIAEEVLINCFWNFWNPTGLDDILAFGQDNFLKLFGCLSKEPHTCERKKALEHLSFIISSWYTDFLEDNITKSQLESLLSSMSQLSWHAVKEISLKGEEFPKLDDINRKLNTFEEAEKTIDDCVWVREAKTQISTSLSSLFRHYNVYSENEDSVLNSILTKYSNESDNVKPDTDTVATLCALQKEKDFIVAFRQEHFESLHIAAYFYQSHKSIFSQVLGYGTWKRLLPEEFFLKIKSSKKYIESIFYSDAVFETVVETAQLILNVGGEFHKETLYLSECPGFEINEIDRENFCSVAVLYQISKPLKDFINCCQQFKFGFVNKDVHFLELSKVSESLIGKAALTWSITDCSMVARRVSTILLSAEQSDGILSEQLTKCLSRLEIFSALSLNSDVWTLALEMKWLGTEGLQHFYREYNNVTNMFLGDSDSFETNVLDSLGPCIRCLSHFSPDDSSLLHFFETIYMNYDSKFSMSDFEVVQQNVTNIREWFTNGMDDIAAIFGIFQQISITGEYRLKAACGLDSNMLYLQYEKKDKYNPKHNVTVMERMEQVSLNDYVERLGFIQNEKKAMSKTIECFIEQHHILLKSVDLLLEMSRIGFPVEDLLSYTFKVSETKLADVNEFCKKVNQSWAKCAKWRRSLYSEYPVSLLFWTEELKEMFYLIQEIRQERNQDVSTMQLICAASRIFITEHNTGQSMVSVTDTTIETLNSISGWDEGRWLDSVSKFLDLLYRKNESLEIPTFSRNNISSSSKIVLHTLSCDANNEKEAVLNIMKFIYEVSWPLLEICFCSHCVLSQLLLIMNLFDELQSRLPRPFEVLDGSLKCTEEKIKIFLDRMLFYPNCLYLVLNAHKLSGVSQEKILSFISHHDIMSKQFQFHIVQKGPTLFHASPWVQRRDWDNASLRSIISSEDQDRFKFAIIDKVYIRSITILSSEKSGTGKTHYIRSKMSELQAENECQMAVVNVHEGTTLAAIVTALKEKFSVHCHRNLVCFTLTFMDADADNGISAGTIDFVNQVFLSLLFLRHLHDPSTAKSFYLGVGQWDIFVELQNPRTMNCEHFHSPTEWLRQNIPILFYSGEIREPKNSYLIDEKAYRVCTYLRAFENGTINRKFEPYRSKRVFFVIDESGSMQANIGGSTALGIATDNALKLFESHLQVNDVS
jgi:hypothetical protein